MGDDKEETSRKFSAVKKGGADRKQKAAMTENKTATSQRRRQRRRRSLFSLLFTGGSQADFVDQKYNQNSSEDKKVDLQLDSKKEIIASNQDSLLKEQARKKRNQRPHNQGVVLIKPRQAKCAEATLVSLVNESQEADDEAEEPTATRLVKVTSKDCSSRHSRATTKDNNSSDQQQKNTLQSLVKRKMRRFKVTKGKSRDEDADSYILDLNDCLDREKLRVSCSSCSSSSVSSLSSISSPAFTTGDQEEQIKARLEANEFTDMREISPIDDKWQTNREYIPTMTTEQQPESNNNNNNNTNKIQQSEANTRRRQQKSPLLVEFLESHQIKLRGNSLDAKQRTALPPPYRSGSSAGSSSCDSGGVPLAVGRGWQKSASGSARLPPVSYFDELQAEARAASKLNELSESERRLYHWRKLAARSVTMWQVPDESSSDEESDDSDLGDFIDCQSPARVCYCSDDTSCSSVELIWSRPSGGHHAPNPIVRLERDTSPAADIQRTLLTRPLHLITKPTSATSSSELSVSPRSPASLSPARSQHQLHQVTTIRSSSHSRTPTPQRLQVYNQHHYHYHLTRYSGNHMDLANSSNNNSLKSVSSSSQSMCQRPAILELAKPSRARDRRIGGDNNKNKNCLNKRTKEEKMAARRSMPAPPTPGRDNIIGNERTRDWSAVPVSRSASGSDWVPNPLFGRLAKTGGAAIENPLTGATRPETPARATLMSLKQAKSCDDHSTGADPDSVAAEVTSAAGARVLLRRHRSIDLHQQQLNEQTESEKIVSGAKSSKFGNFLKRIKRLDTTSQVAVQKESDSDKNNSSRELEDEFDAADDAGAAFTDRSKRHRWSLRMRSPFANHHGTGNENHAYLSHLVNGLDTRRIKSNVSSFKSQLGERLSDTGKRASVLADQLMTSIKDTTKEQLLLATTGTTARDRYDTLPNSFASSPSLPSDPLLVRKQLLAKDNEEDGLTTQQRKAKLFSLIYMHQQQQAIASGGRPVITRQPQLSAVFARGVRPMRSPPPVDTSFIHDESKAVELEPSDGSDQPQVDLDKLLDPKALRLDRFRALVRGLRHKPTKDIGELTSEYQRMSKTIAFRDRQLATDALEAGDAEAGHKLRASCTV